MKKYIIGLDKEEIEIVKMIFTDFHHQQFLGDIDAAILRGILDQILTQDRRFAEKK